jgi:hypothetical protein
MRFCEEELDEVAVLPLGDAIPDGAGIARHLEVLAEGFGQLLTARLGQFKDAAVNLADLLRGEESEGWITVCGTAISAGVSQGDWLLWRRILGLPIRASLLRNNHIRLLSCLLFRVCIGLYSLSLRRHRNTQEHGQHQAGGFGQITGLISPGLAAELCPGDMHHRDLQPGAALPLTQLGGPADAAAEGGAG